MVLRQFVFCLGNKSKSTFRTIYEIDSRSIKDLNVKNKTLKLLNIGGNAFISMTQKPYTIKGKKVTI